MILLAALSLLAAPALAAYTQPTSKISAGSGEMASSGHSNLAVVGQTGIVGNSISASYKADHGFLPGLGGFKILYPIIALDKDTVAFTIASNSNSSSQSLSIINTGGSTLNWTVTKTLGSAWLTTTPNTGSGNFTVAVNVLTAGLAVGNIYTDTLTFSGAGIDQTASVAVSLQVVAPSTYRLTVTVVSDNATKGGGTVTDGHGTINCYNTGSNQSNARGTCQADLATGTSITLLQAPYSDSIKALWSARCTPNGTNCTINNINSDTSIIATFPYSYMARVESLVAPNNGYDSLASAYGAAAMTDTIKARAVIFSEGTITFNGGKSIKLLGGLDAYYQPVIGNFTTIKGILKIGGNGGKLSVNGVKIGP